MSMIHLPAKRLALVALLSAGCAAGNVKDTTYRPYSAPVSWSSTDDPACAVKSIQKLPTAFEGRNKSPVSDLVEIHQPDAKNVYQLYMSHADKNDLQCLTCVARPGAPRVDRNKTMVTWQPSGQWLIVGVEEDKHGNSWMPKSWQRGWLQSGLWLNMWVTTPTGDRWYQLTDFKKANGPSDGFVGTAFTSDGKRAVWAEIVDGNIFANTFGIWRLYLADFNVSADGTPSFINKRDITPRGAKWVEPGNFAPDNRHLLISADIGLSNAQEQDQFTLDIVTGEVRNLTNSREVWDEHGLYSPNGQKITFMSSYPYRDKRDSYKVSSLKTELMMMDADGSHLRQLTHFNVPGYPESQREKTVAAEGKFIGDGSEMLAMVMAPEFGKSNWIITFQGRCGGR
jgi:hypothetical protein